MARPRFQFRLRTLMIGVTLFCVLGGFVAREVTIARQRRAMRDKLLILRGMYSSNATKQGVPWLRRLLGDEPMDELFIPLVAPDEDAKEIEEAFPEARAVIRPTPSVESDAREAFRQAHKL